MNLTKQRLVAIGDSLTEGVGDPSRGALRGWIHYLATESAAASELTLIANLGRRGATVATVRARQLDRVVALAPDIVTCAVGVNDVLSSRFDATAFEFDYDHVVASVTKVAARGVLTMTLHDIAAGLPLPGAARTALRDRVRQANTVIERVSERHGAWVMEARTATSMAAAGLLSIDRLHPNRRGHRYIASHAADVLREHGAVAKREPRAGLLPPADPMLRRMAAAAVHLRWLCRHVAKPVIHAQFARCSSPPAGAARGQNGPHP